VYSEGGPYQKSEHEQDWRGNKENVVLITSATSQVNFKKNKKIDEVFEGLGKARWRPWLP
jgi:hypothetical protein